MLTAQQQTFLELLITQEIPYLIIGANAMSIHNCSRPTKHLDLWIDCSSNEKLYEVLHQFGFPFDIFFKELWLKKPKGIVVATDLNWIILFNHIKGLTFNDCYQSKVNFSYENLNLTCLNKDDLILSKQSIGLPKDHKDIQSLLII